MPLWAGCSSLDGVPPTGTDLDESRSVLIENYGESDREVRVEVVTVDADTVLLEETVTVPAGAEASPQFEWSGEAPTVHLTVSTDSDSDEMEVTPGSGVRLWADIGSNGSDAYGTV